MVICFLVAVLTGLDIVFHNLGEPTLLQTAVMVAAIFEVVSNILDQKRKVDE